MYCRKCGNPVKEEANYCGFCGTEILPLKKVEFPQEELVEEIIEEKEEKLESKASDSIVLGVVSATMVISVLLILIVG